MSLVIAQGLALSYGPKVILRDAGFAIGPHDRIGLVGANGTGKSTLLRILAGQKEPDAGRLTFRRDTRLGYLPQELSELPEGTLVEAVRSAVPGRDALEERLAHTQEALARATVEAEQLELSELLAELLEQQEHFEERFGAHRAAQILLGLGFSRSDFGQALSTFSGGWRMRAALAGLLLTDPDLLLLDEPTNHLDLPTLAWFDAFLRRSRKALVLVTHDRQFLDRQVGRIISLEVEGLRTWTGNFEAYREQRAVEAEVLLARAEKVEARRAELQAFVDRFRAKASKAAAAQSKLKALQKLETVQVHQERSSFGFRFPPAPPSGREVARLEGVSRSFGTKQVYRQASGQVLRGERLAVVGLNGAGKTTLLKLLAGELAPDEGTVTLGHNVTLGYYAQHHADTLDRSKSILETIAALAPDRSQAWVRGVLGAFLFSGDDVDKKVGVLSGGERARVALARLLVRPANLLVMDEPTNHLDLDSSEALIEALEDYQGTLVFVSHNRSFLDALATRVWDVKDGALVSWPGNLADYLSHLELEAARREAVDDAESARADGGGATAGGGASAKERRRREAQARESLSSRLKPLKKELAQVEAEIAALEAAQKEREGQLADPAFASDFAASRPVLEAYRAGAERLEFLLGRWEALGTELAALEAT